MAPIERFRASNNTRRVYRCACRDALIGLAGLLALTRGRSVDHSVTIAFDFRKLRKLPVAEGELDALKPVAVAARDPALLVNAFVGVEMVIDRNGLDFASAQ